ncbi:unnamed protein product [Rhizopus stolonifer]
MRQLLDLLKKNLEDLIKADSNNFEKAAAALKILQSWRSTKSMFTKKPEKSTNNGTLKINNNYGIAFAGPNINVHCDKTHEGSSTIPFKKAFSEENSSTDWSWNSTNKSKNTKLLKIYLSSVYDETNFGGVNDQSIRWVVDNIDMTAVLREFREKCIKGAQMRKSLSEHRTLALSFIFLISNNSSVFSTFSSDEKALIMKDLGVNKNLKMIQESTVLTCHKMHQMLQQDGVNEDEANEKIDDIRRSCADHDGKVATRIVSSLLNRILNLSKNKESESNLIIETLRPFIANCIISPCKDIKFEWITYRMLSYTNDGQLMIPDLVVYVDPLSTINFELFIIELGKEMKLAIDKLVVYKVENPEIVGLLVEGVKVTAFKMDLAYNGQYRMLEMGQFFVFRDNVNDIMLLPSIMQKLDQIKVSDDYFYSIMIF